MGLRLGDAVRLSWTNIAQHKGRSVTIVVTMAVLFGTVMGFVVLMEGLRQTLLAASLQETEGELYALVQGDGGCSSYRDWLESPGEVETLELMPLANERTEERVKNKLSEYNAEPVGYVWRYDLGWLKYNVMDEALAENFMTEKLSEVEEGKVPILLARGGDFDEEFVNVDPRVRERLKQRIEATTQKVGEIPGMESGSPTLEGANPLNIMLEMIWGGEKAGMYLVDDGTGKVEEFVREQIKQYLEDVKEMEIPEMVSVGNLPPTRMMVAKFKKVEDAVRYSRKSEKLLGIFEIRTKEVAKDSAHDLFTNTMTIVSVFENWDTMLSILEGILIVVAVVVATFTLAHVIDQDVATIALYRSMGASTNNVYAIYFLYVLELCGLAILTCLGMTLIFTGTVWIMSGGALAVRLEEYYMLAKRPEVVLFGVNGMFWTIIVMILIVAPLVIGLSSRRFTPQHIARKLKED